MPVGPSVLWKLALAIALGAAIIASASAEAPRKPVPGADLRWLMSGALALYAVGIVAVLKHHGQVAILLFAGGIATSTLAAWLSRGRDAGGGPPRDDEPSDAQPPPGPDGVPGFDWAQFERELLAYMDRSRAPVGSR
jgi:hypothetical protein